MVQIGDRVKIQGREVRVIGRTAAGKHVRWDLDDGSTVLDLVDKVASGQVEVLKDTPKLHRQDSILRTEPEIERMPRDYEDIEE